jgi:hypothetical protein
LFFITMVTRRWHNENVRHCRELALFLDHWFLLLMLVAVLMMVVLMVVMLMSMIVKLLRKLAVNLASVNVEMRTFWMAVVLALLYHSLDNLLFGAVSFGFWSLAVTALDLYQVRTNLMSLWIRD